MVKKKLILVFFCFIALTVLLFINQGFFNKHIDSKNNYSGSNILLITLESVRPDHLGIYGFEKNITPNIDSVGAKSTIFTNAYSQSGWTVPSIASIFTSLYPNQHKLIHHNTRLSENITTLPEILKSHGYTTHAYVSHVLLKKDYGLDQGFDVYDQSVLKLGNPHKISTSKPMTDKIIGDLENISQPFFIWAHYFDPHYYYNNHDDFNFGTTAKEKYTSEIAFMDYHIGRLLSALDEKNMLEDTIIILLADHGEEFAEHDGKYHRTLYQEVVRIPLIIKLPESIGKSINDCSVDQVDITPTILDLLGIEKLSVHKGISVFSNHPCEKPIFLDRKKLKKAPVRKSVISNNKKLIITYNKGDISSKEYYDLLKDPSEKNKNALTNEEKEKLESLLKSYDLLQQENIEGIEISQEAKKALQEMGYL